MCPSNRSKKPALWMNFSQHRHSSHIRWHYRRGPRRHLRRRNRRHALISSQSRHRDCELGRKQRPLNAQHPAQRPQHLAQPRRCRKQCHHLRLAQQMAQLAGIPGRLIRHQHHQPSETPRQPYRRRRRPRRAPGTSHPPRNHPPAPQPPRPNRCHHHQKPPLDAPDPSPDQNDHRRLQPPPNTPLSHRLAQPLDGKREALGQGKQGEGEKLHEHKLNDFGTKHY